MKIQIRAYKSHFGMVVASVIAIFVSCVLALSAIFIDHLGFTLPLFIRNWGTAFMVITFTGLICPLTPWAFAICKKIGLKPDTLPHILVENAVNTLIYNTTATLILAAVNIFDNARIEGAIAAGALPFNSVTAFYIHTVLHDFPITFAIAYVFAFVITKLAIRVAKESVEAAMAESKKAMAEVQREKAKKHEHF